MSTLITAIRARPSPGSALSVWSISAADALDEVLYEINLIEDPGITVAFGNRLDHQDVPP